MKNEDQIIFITKIVQSQRAKNPKASEEVIYGKVRTICNNLILSDELSKDVVEKMLSMLFESVIKKNETKRRQEESRIVRTRSSVYDTDPCGYSGGGRSPC